LNRLLQPNGRLVWSTPKDNPNFFWIFLASWRVWVRVTKLPVALEILRYAQELKRRWKEGWYHYLSAEETQELMSAAGFVRTKLVRTYAGQAFAVRGWKP
jgi:ubiquinone/menaquinone biosynthesis C-methylase UbiE